MTPEQLEARNAAIRLAWDDPLRLALARERARPIYKVSLKDRAEIRALSIIHGWSQRRLALSYLVSKPTIQKILADAGRGT